MKGWVECLDAALLEWEKNWNDDGGKDINNPKIPLSFVAQNGELLYEPTDAGGPKTKGLYL